MKSKDQILLEEAYNRVLSEKIKASEARNEYDSFKTVIDGKRTLGVVTKNTLDGDLKLKKEIIEKGFKLILVRSSRLPGNYIIYHPSGLKQALELQALADRYDGAFGPPHASEDDVRRVGQLLEYDPSDIEAHIERSRLFPKTVDEKEYFNKKLKEFYNQYEKDSAKRDSTSKEFQQFLKTWRNDFVDTNGAKS